ncbi:glycosyltransferase family 10 (fucosyltransferase) c-term domain-containing protein [Phthorimaea operculella]|nr:glycosyltransferase family 10 (fucosyltransferase) c-term domain-containing protein [Phthorimaea operculella]
MEPFIIGGREPFIQNNCSFTNCFVTSDRNHFNDVRYFDAIVFHGPDFWYIPALLDGLPRLRSRKQMYVYCSAESADNYAFCDEEIDDFFNVTWTYRLNSDLPAPYLIVTDKTGAIIGPKEIMHWKDQKTMLPIDESIKKKLQKKSKAVAWLVSICKTASEREKYVTGLNNALKPYWLTVDIFGKCGSMPYKCGRPDLMLPDCWEMIEEEYYFYLSFENSFDEDYVTEKLLYPLQHYTVPIVYGGANYTRFVPDGAYINAKGMAPTKLAKEIHDIITDQERYYGFFKWHNYYSYHHPTAFEDTNPICSFCKMLNRGVKGIKGAKQTYHSFRKWWNLPGVCPTEEAPYDIHDYLFI